MAQQTIRVKGYRETARALGRVNKDAKKAMFVGMRAAAEPIAADARTRLARYRGLTTTTIGPSARTTGVFITQRAKKRTGLRPDFGSLQMREGLIPALENREDDVAERVEDAILVLTKLEGF